MFKVFKKSLPVDTLAELIAKTTADDPQPFQLEYLGSYGQNQHNETVVFLCALAALAVSMTKISERDIGAFYKALYAHFGAYLDPEISNELVRDAFMASSVGEYLESMAPERIADAHELGREVVDGCEFINYPGVLLHHYLKRRVPNFAPDARLLVLKQYVLSTVTGTKRCISEMNQQYKLDFSSYYH